MKMKGLYFIVIATDPHHGLRLPVAIKASCLAPESKRARRVMAGWSDNE